MTIQEQIGQAIRTNPEMRVLNKYTDSRIYSMLSDLCASQKKPATVQNMVSFAAGLDSDLEGMFSGGAAADDEGLVYEY